MTQIMEPKSFKRVLDDGYLSAAFHVATRLAGILSLVARRALN